MVLGLRRPADRVADPVVEAAETELRTAVKDSPSAEVRRSAALLLQIVEGWKYPLTGEALRTVRAIEVLERTATPEARKLLHTLAKGAPAARLTHRACRERSTPGRS